MESQDDPGSGLPPAHAESAEVTPTPVATTPPPRPARTPTDPPPRLSRPSIAGMRRSLLSLPVFKPRWQPWSPARVVATTLGFAVVAALLVTMTLRVTRRWAMATPVSAVAALAADREAAPAAPARARPRADAALSREHRSPVAGGLLTLPPAFSSEDGAYDLLIHFHGNTDLVEESVALSGLNAVVVIMNLGVGSGPYEDRFGNPLSLPEVVDRAQATMEKRGLAHATLRRLSLSGWSAGYGAVLKILEQPALAAKVDAVLLMDGIHVGYQPQSHDLILERLAPFERFAREAVEGRRLFSITHTRIIPVGNYAGTRETTDALLHAVGVPRVPGGEQPALPALRSIDGVIAKKLLIGLTPEDVARKGGLVVRGYAGDQPEHHMAHLIHMATTVLPDLVAWWKR
jgi:hypothetical protein